MANLLGSDLRFSEGQKKVGGIELGGWYAEMAQDRALWRAVVCHLAPPGETTYNDPHTQTATNQPPS